VGREKPDHYAQRAKKEGFPARSVYKLKEIDRKFRLLREGGRVLDIGAAPGSWSMFAAQRLGPAGVVVAVDLKDFEIERRSRSARVECFVGDAFRPEVLSELAERAPFDLVLSDAAPATSGTRSLDTARSAALVESVLALVDRFLDKGGHMVTKIFQGSEEREIVEQMRSRFSAVHRFRPAAVRKESFETFLIGLKKEDEA
jgi:23S rRNA (uridine2552-2'-O)-methyltransferase